MRNPKNPVVRSKDEKGDTRTIWVLTDIKMQKDMLHVKPTHKGGFKLEMVMRGDKEDDLHLR